VVGVGAGQLMVSGKPRHTWKASHSGSLGSAGKLSQALKC
jgi:hypothetical protein